MNYYAFEYPFYIFLLLPILYCMYKCKEFIQPVVFVHLHFMSAKKSFFKYEWLVKISILVLLTISLCSPIIVDKLDPLNRFGKDIILALDASGSMNASGFSTDEELKNLSRFEITKKIADRFLQKRVSDNVGIVLYGDFAFIASPITYEKNILSQMLDYLTIGMAGQNTAIGEAIAMGVRAFEFSHAKSRVLILLTDGEQNSGAISPKAATNLAKKNNIKIYTIAIGKEDESDNSLLELIAKQSGGEFYRAANSAELEDIYSTIDKLESSSIKSKEYLKKEYYYFVFLLLACGLVYYLLLKETSR